MLKDKDGKLLSRSEGEAVMKGRGAVAISIYALILALVSIYSSGNSSGILNATLTINDTWSFFQSKSIKQAISQSSADNIEAYLQERESKPDLRLTLEAKLTKLKSDIARYETDPASGEGKRELMKRAQRLETERDLLKRKGLYFSIAGGLLQIAIVLSSTSILAVNMALLWTSVGCGLAGCLCFLNGFLSLFI